MVHQPIFIFSWLPALIFMAALSYGGPETAQSSIKATPAGTENSIRIGFNRDRFLTHHVTGFHDCHTKPDFSRFAGPSITGKEGRVGRVFYPGRDEPGQIFNRTFRSTVLIEWTNEERTMAIAEGIHKKWGTSVAHMPKMAYSQLAATDVQDVVRYFRHLAPNEKTFLPPILFIPLEASVSPHLKPDRSTPVKDSNEYPLTDGHILS
jgi:hypothetical protein